MAIHDPRKKLPKPNDSGYVEGYGYIALRVGAECGSDSDAACFVCSRCQYEGITIFEGILDLGAACQDCLDDRRP